MTLYSATAIGSESSRNIELSSGQAVFNFHPADTCLGDVCPVHKPSEHPLRELPLAFTGSNMVRIIEHVEPFERCGIVIPDISDRPLFVVIDPDDYGFSISGEAILRNSLICDNCGDEIESTYRHDYKTCSCGQCMVDGGLSYLRRGGAFLDTSIVFKKPNKESKR